MRRKLHEGVSPAWPVATIAIPILREFDEINVSQLAPRALTSYDILPTVDGVETVIVPGSYLALVRMLANTLRRRHLHLHPTPPPPLTPTRPTATTHNRGLPRLPTRAALPRPLHHLSACRP